MEHQEALNNISNTIDYWKKNDTFNLPDLSDINALIAISRTMDQLKVYEHECDDCNTIILSIDPEEGQRICESCFPTE